MDTKYNFPSDKDKRPELNGLQHNCPEEDESLLRQPLRTSSAGFREAKRAYENGTDEVRRLLMQECSLIYECNVCRNMFRSLANFISHKRIYCKQLTEGNSYHSYSGQNSSVLIKTIERPEPWLNKSRSTGSSPVPTLTKSSNRDLSKVIERLKRVDVSSSESKQKSQETKRVTTSPVTITTTTTGSDPVLQLERVPTTTQAVYQTLTTSENISDSIKTEVDEVHNLLTNQKTLVGADGKAIVSHSFMYGPDPTLDTSSSALMGLHDNYTNLNALAIVCEICKMPFQTEKTLKIHIQKKHTSSTYVFQCPTCSLTFLQPAAVIRHLANEHKKPLRRIRKMRDSILKKRIQIGDVQVKGPSREVKRLKLNETKDVEDNILQQQNGKPISTCTYCKKNFERRAALATHLTSCPARKLPGSTNNMDTSSKTKIENEEKLKPNKIRDQNTNQHLEQRQNKKTNEVKKLEEHKTIVNIKQEPQEELSTTNNTSTTSSSSSTINEMFENLEKQTFGNGLQTVSLDKLDLMVDRKMEEEEIPEEVIKQDENEEDTDHHDKEAVAKVTAVNGEKKKTKRFRIVPASKQLACRCKICNKQFNALSNLRRHISMFHYRSRRFGCNLCDYRAFRRYDIVNHLTFVHKMSGERETMAVEHVTVHDIKYSRDDVEGDIVVVNEQQQTNDEGATKFEQQQLEQQESQQLPQVATVKTYEKRGKRKKVLLPSSSEDQEQANNEDATTDVELSHIKVVRKRLKKALANQVEGQQNRPIRNRIKTVNKDFVYDLLTLKDEPKEPARLGPKRRSTLFVDHNIELSPPPPIKISPYRLRTEPLITVSKETIKGFANSVYRNAIHEGLAAPATLPELPAERPQMRSRLISSSRNDSNPVPVIETMELEAARLKSTLFDDSFLEKFAKKSNPSFRMKPLLALQHSPLNSILQKFDTTLQNTSKQSTPTGSEEIIKTNNYDFVKPLEQLNNSPPDFSVCSLSSLTEQSLQEMEITPNGKHILEPSSPPSTPKKRITLMQRLAENRAKRRDSLLRNALEN